MSDLEGFEPISAAHQRRNPPPAIRILGNGTIHINQNAYNELGRPAHVKLLLRHSDLTLAIVPCSADDPQSIAPRVPSETGGAQLSAAPLLRTIGFEKVDTDRLPARVQEGIAFITLPPEDQRHRRGR